MFLFKHVFQFTNYILYSNANNSDDAHVMGSVFCINALLFIMLDVQCPKYIAG